MWQLEYTAEAKSYFIDNYPYTFPLLIEIEKLKFTSGGIPPEGCTPIDSSLLWWEVLDHIVIYERLPDVNQLIIASIKPM